MLLGAAEGSTARSVAVAGGAIEGCFSGEPVAVEPLKRLTAFSSVFAAFGAAFLERLEAALSAALALRSAAAVAAASLRRICSNFRFRTSISLFRARRARSAFLSSISALFAAAAASFSSLAS